MTHKLSIVVLLLTALSLCFAFDASIPRKLVEVEDSPEVKRLIQAGIYPSTAIESDVVHVGEAEKKLLTESDFINHPAINTSLTEFLAIEKTMARDSVRASFHSYVHIIAVGIQLINATTMLEIGSYCGATIALGLSVPSIRHLVSIDMRPSSRGTNTHDIIRKNIKTFNVHNATVDFIPGNSREESVRDDAFRVLPKHSVDIFFIDGDHFYPVPDFEYYQHVLRPGGLLIWDDFGNHKNVRGHVTTLARSNEECFHIVGQPMNVAGATYLGMGQEANHMEQSNEFIMQKRWDCKNWVPR